MNYSLALTEYYLKLLVCYFLRLLILAIHVPALILNLIIRLEVVLNFTYKLWKAAGRITVLKPIGGSFQDGVNYWRKVLKRYDRNLEFCKNLREDLIKHLGGRETTGDKTNCYIGYKYLRAASYAHARTIKNMIK